MRGRVRRLLDEQSTLTGRIIGGFILLLILASCAAVMCETLPSIPHSWRPWFRRFEVFSVTVFTIEYLLRLWSSRTPRKKLLEPLMVIDFLSIIPFYIGLIATGGIDLGKEAGIATGVPDDQRLTPSQNVAGNAVLHGHDNGSHFFALGPCSSHEVYFAGLFI